MHFMGGTFPQNLLDEHGRLRTPRDICAICGKWADHEPWDCPQLVMPGEVLGATSRSERRWQLVQRYTWLTVVVGDALILGFLGLLVTVERFELNDFWRAAGVTVLAGLPILFRELVRHLLHDLRHERQIREE